MSENVENLVAERSMNASCENLMERKVRMINSCRQLRLCHSRVELEVYNVLVPSKRNQRENCPTGEIHIRKHMQREHELAKLSLMCVPMLSIEAVSCRCHYMRAAGFVLRGDPMTTPRERICSWSLSSTTRSLPSVFGSSLRCRRRRSAA